MSSPVQSSVNSSSRVPANLPLNESKGLQARKTLEERAFEQSTLSEKKTDNCCKKTVSFYDALKELFYRLGSAIWYCLSLRCFFPENSTVKTVEPTTRSGLTKTEEKKPEVKKEATPPKMDPEPLPRNTAVEVKKQPPVQSIEESTIFQLKCNPNCDANPLILHGALKAPERLEVCRQILKGHSDVNQRYQAFLAIKSYYLPKAVSFFDTEVQKLENDKIWIKNFRGSAKDLQTLVNTKYKIDEAAISLLRNIQFLASLSEEFFGLEAKLAVDKNDFSLFNLDQAAHAQYGITTYTSDIIAVEARYILSSAWQKLSLATCQKEDHQQGWIWKLEWTSLAYISRLFDEKLTLLDCSGAGGGPKTGIILQTPQGFGSFDELGSDNPDAAYIRSNYSPAFLKQEPSLKIK